MVLAAVSLVQLRFIPKKKVTLQLEQKTKQTPNSNNKRKTTVVSAISLPSFHIYYFDKLIVG